tara:strand:- start:2602 stop:3030 length:429 start_codon:yes stop_codon:yes gene_type:complete
MSLNNIEAFHWQAPLFSELHTQFTTVHTWQEKYRLLMQLGRQLPDYPIILKIELYAIKGCESRTWLAHQEIDGRHLFLADSEARIMKGLLVILLSLCHNKKSAELKTIDFKKNLEEFGLLGYLSVSRGNGLMSLISQIKQVI